MKGGVNLMMLLKIEEPSGFFLGKLGEYVPIDKIDKEELLRLVGLTLTEETAKIEKFDDSKIKNKVHQLIYRSISQKLSDLKTRRKVFVDSTARLFLAEYERYRDT
jgi:hypothetical protein